MIVRGDSLSLSIAAASVIAKVTRDRIMAGMHERYPAYDFATHKGYCTPEHQDALDRHGPCPEHRRRFVNVRRVEDGPGLASYRPLERHPVHAPVPEETPL